MKTKDVLHNLMVALAFWKLGIIKFQFSLTELLLRK